MTTYRFTGASANVKQASKITVANTWAQNDTCTLSIDSVDFVITIGTLVTTTQVATTIYQAITGTTLTDTSASCTIPVADGGANHIPQYKDFVATNNTASQVLLTGGTNVSPAGLEGKPFTITSTDNTAGTGTCALSSVTTPTSQFHADQADNYTPNGVPTGGSDTLVFDNGSVDVRWGLDYATTLTAINLFQSYTGSVGLPEVNADNSASPYHEYRTTYLTCTGCTTANLGLGQGTGTGRFKLNTGSAAASAINVFNKGTRIESGIPCYIWKGTHASNTVSNLNGDLGIALFGGETATVATLVNGNGPQSTAYTFCGSGTTLTTVRIVGGQVVTNSAITTAVIHNGQLDHYSGTIGTLTSNGGTVYIHGACTITTTGTMYGKIDLSQSAGTVTFTNLVTLDGQAEIYDPNGKASFGAGYKLASLTAKVTRPVGDTHTLS